MLVPVLDGNGNPIGNLVFQAQEPATDFSDSIAVDNQSKEVAPANENRSGLVFQNKSGSVMWVSEVGDSGPDEPAAFQVLPGQFWPPPGYPIPVTAINVAGTAGAPYVYREW